MSAAEKAGRAVVTGGAGFIGSHIVDALHKKGLSVAVIDDLSTGKMENLSVASDHTPERFAFYRCDIGSAEASAAISEFKPDVVVHHAAQMNVRRSVSEPQFDATVNVVGTVNLLEASRLAGVKQFVLASSGGAIYGDQTVYPAPENHATRPDSAYGVSKLCGEHYLEYFAKLYGLNTVALRYANVYGPRQNSKGEAGVVSIFCEQILSGAELRVNGDGEQTRDFVYVDDVVAANVAVIERMAGKGFSTINIGTGRETSVNQLVELLRRVSAADVKVTHGPALAGEQRRSVIDFSLASSKLGWQPAVAIENGIRQTFESFRRR